MAALSLLVFAAFAACDNAEDIPELLLTDGNGVSALSRPRVVSTNPAGNGGTYPGNLEIYADFSVAMDTEATRNAFSVTGAASPSGLVQWDGDRRIKYKLDEDLVPGNSYQLKVGRNAKSKEGYLLEIDHIVFFTVGSRIDGPTVVSTTPADNAQAVDIAAPLRIIFSRPMNQASTEAAFKISPSAAGAFTWDADSLAFTYTPYTDLTFATTYSVTIGVGATDTEGIPLASTHTFSFQAGTDFTNPTILGVRESAGVTSIPDGAAGVFKDAAFVVSFDEAMNFDETESAFSLTRLSDSSSVSGVFSWAANFQSVTFTPDSPLEPENWYRLEVTTSAQDQAGNSPSLPLQVQFYVDNSGTYSGTAAAHSTYLRVTRVDKVTPAPVQTNLTPIDNNTIHSLTIGTGPQTVVMDIVFDKTLDANTIAENVTVTRLIAKPGTSAATIIGLQRRSDGGTNNAIRVTMSGFHNTDYLLEVLGSTGGLKSDATLAPGETGSWLQNDVKIYLRGI